MKYIDERRMRFGYVAIFGLAVLLIGGALWDATYNNERLLTWFISGLGGLLALAILFFVATELILRDALDLRPRPQPADDGDRWLVQTGSARPVPPSGASAAGSSNPSSLARSLTATGTASTWSEPRLVSPTVSVPPPVVVTALPPAAASKEPASPQAIPRPVEVPSAPGVLAVEELPYERGNHQFRLPRGTRGRPGEVLENTRVLCSSCGLYFRVDLERSRPTSVQCPGCQRDLGLSGATETAAHVKIRCRFCGDFLRVPRLNEHHAVQCATCGQAND